MDIPGIWCVSQCQIWQVRELAELFCKAVSSSNSSVLIQVTTSAEAAPGIQQHSGGQISFTMEMETITHHQHHMRMSSGYNKEEIVEALTFWSTVHSAVAQYDKITPMPFVERRNQYLALIRRNHPVHLHYLSLVVIIRFYENLIHFIYNHCNNNTKTILINFIWSQSVS